MQFNQTLSAALHASEPDGVRQLHPAARAAALGALPGEIEAGAVGDPAILPTQHKQVRKQHGRESLRGAGQARAAGRDAMAAVPNTELV